MLKFYFSFASHLLDHFQENISWMRPPSLTPSDAKVHAAPHSSFVVIVEGDPNAICQKYLALAKTIRAEISALPSTSADFSNPASLLRLPFPHPNTALLPSRPTSRFDIVNERFFDFMGRTSFSQVDKAISAPPQKLVNIYGTKGYGKSHVIAASVVLQLKQGQRVVFIPHSRSFATSPFESLLCALLLAFADDEAASADLIRVSINDVSALVAWAVGREFTLVVDQMNSLEEASKVLFCVFFFFVLFACCFTVFALDVSRLISFVFGCIQVSPAEKQQAKDIIKALSTGKRVVRGFSANNQTAGEMYKDRPNEFDIRLFGGFSEQVLQTLS